MYVISPFARGPFNRGPFPPAGGLPAGFDYYVDPATGNDSNDGSRAAPFATHAAVRTVINALGAAEAITVYIVGATYTDEHLDLSTGTAAAGASVAITFGAGYILDAGALTTGGIQCGGAASWSMTLNGDAGTRAIIRNFDTASANGLGLHNTCTLTVNNFEVTACEDGVSNHNTGGLLTTNNCYFHDNTRSEVVHAGGTSVHNGDTIQGLGTESNGLIVTVSGAPTTFNTCNIIPAGTYGTSFPASGGSTGGLLLSLGGTTTFDGCTIGDIGVKSAYIGGAGTVTIEDSVIDIVTDSVRTMNFTRAAGYFTTRTRSTGTYVFRNCDFRGGATNRPTSVFGASNSNSLLVRTSALGGPSWDMLDCMVTGFANTAIGQGLDATDATSMAGIAAFQIKNCAFRNNGTDIDADLVTAGGSDIANNITTDPLLSLSPGDGITSWGYRAGSPCIGAGSAGGNIGFATA